MGARAHRLIHALLAALLVAPVGLSAQQRTSAADSTRPDVVFDETMPAGMPQYVVLARGIAYRVEVLPAAAIVIEPRVPGPAPLYLRPTADEGPAQHGASYIVAPTDSGEYRVEVFGNRDPVRVRIATDPRETALLTGHAHSALHEITIGVGYTALAGNLQVVFFDVGRNKATSRRGAAAGPEGCIGIVPGVLTLAPKIGGCIMTFGSFNTVGHGTLIMFGTAPTYVLKRFGRYDFAAEGVWLFGDVRNNGLGIFHTVVGAGGSLEWTSRHVLVRGSADLALMRRGGFDDDAVEPPKRVSGSNVIGVRFSLGVHLHA